MTVQDLHHLSQNCIAVTVILTESSTYCILQLYANALQMTSGTTDHRLTVLMQ